MQQKELAKKIKIAMVDSGINQESLAEKLKTAQQVVSNWITGRRNPKMDSLKKIAKATGKPLSFFIEDSDSAANQNDSSKALEIAQKYIAKLEEELAQYKAKEKK
jgi:Predicted transcriptional regulator